MKMMTDSTTNERAWRFLIAEATADELVQKLGELHDAIEYKRNVEQALRGEWMSQG